jgi:hypothetical protein
MAVANQVYRCKNGRYYGESFSPHGESRHKEFRCRWIGHMSGKVEQR